MTTNEIDFLLPVTFVIATAFLVNAWIDGNLPDDWGLLTILAAIIWLVLLLGTLIWLWGLISSSRDS